MATLYAVPDALWYRPGAIAVSATGLIAISTGSCILLARVDERNSDAASAQHPATSAEASRSETTETTSGIVGIKRSLRFLKKINLFNEKCNAIAFSCLKSNGAERMALLLDQNLIKVIDYPSMETVFSEKYPSEIRTIRFMNDRPYCLLLGLLSAEICIVDMTVKSLQRNCKLNVKIQSELLQDVDVRNGLAIIGCSKGSVAIVDTRTWKVLNKQKLTSVIRAVSWHPDGTVAAAMSIAEKSCLVISPKDAFSIPLPSKAIRATYTDKELLTACVCWSGSSLVIGSPWGTVCAGVYKGTDTVLSVIAQDVTTKSLCAMVSVAPNVVLTSGIDRTLCVWDTQSLALSIARPCLAGFVYDMKFHPAGTGALAIASGCGRVCLAKTDQGTLEQIAKHLSVKCRVYCVAWHPTNEMQLALGTQKGEVFVVDISPQKMATNKLTSPQRTGIGSICFASIPLISEYPLVLAADCNQAFVGKSKNGSLIYLDMFIKDLDKYKIWSVDAINDRNLLFLGTRMGKVLTVDTSGLAIISETILERHAVQKTAISASGSYLAAVYGYEYFSIFSVDQLVKANRSHPVVAMLKVTGHSCTAFCWNPFMEKEFAIGGINGSVQVRKLGTSRILKSITNLTGHKSVMCMQWSTINENLIYLGSTGHTIYELNVADSNDVVDDGTTIEISLTDKPKNERSASSGTKNKGSKNRSLFPFSSNAENVPKSEGLEDLLLYQSCKAKEDYSAMADKMQLGFYHKDLLQRTLETEASKHQAKMDDDLAFQVLLTGGSNIRDVVQRAIRQKRLNYQLLSLSHFVSGEFFLEDRFRCLSALERVVDFMKTAEALIAQNKDSDIHSILALMVATGHVKELVQILCSRDLHKEAISVVLSNPDLDASLAKVAYESWANRFIECAQYERAARCFIASDQPEKALEVLNLYSDPLSALTAAILAKRVNLPHDYLLLKATRELLSSPVEVDKLDRLSVEFGLDVLGKLKCLSHHIREFFEESKPSVDAAPDAHSLYSQPRESFESVVEKAGIFSEIDHIFIEELLTDFQPAQNVNQLLSHIVLEIASGLTTGGSGDGSGDGGGSGGGGLENKAKLRISNKVGEFEEGKFMHFVLAMLDEPSDNAATASQRNGVQI